MNLSCFFLLALVVLVAAVSANCPIENGFCVKKNGHDQNDGVHKINSNDGNTDAAQALCLGYCKSRSGATGCEVIWHQGNRGCYVHTREVDRGNGAGRHKCWIFSKCKKDGSEGADAAGTISYYVVSEGNHCWGSCENKGGACRACGEGGMCCRSGWKDCPDIANRVAPANHHSCVRPKASAAGAIEPPAPVIEADECQPICNPEWEDGQPIVLIGKACRTGKSRFLTSMPVFPSNYAIKFEFLPTKFAAGWHNVVHFSKGGNIEQYGDRTPGVFWFPSHEKRKTNRLHICSPIDSNRNWCVDSRDLPVSKWVKVEISQIDGIYAVKVNGKYLRLHRNTKQQSFKNVMIYASDPWYGSQPGMLQNFEVMTNPPSVEVPDADECKATDPEWKDDEPTMLIKEPCKPVKGRLLTVLPIMPTTYGVSFEFLPTAFASGWHNILHFSIGEDSRTYGDRTPGVWFHPSHPTRVMNKLHICSPIDGNSNWCVNSGDYPINQWVKIEISQVEGIYTVKVNDEILKTHKNTKQETFRNVKIFTSDPWYPANPGILRNFQVMANLGDCGKCSKNATCNQEMKCVCLCGFIGDGKTCVKLTDEEVLPEGSMEISLPGECALVKNTLITTIPYLSAGYVVKFDIFPVVYQQGWSSILHFTKGEDHQNYGSRTPAIWFEGTDPRQSVNQLYICSAVDSNRNYCVRSPRTVPVGKWSQIEITQLREPGTIFYRYQVRVNGAVVTTVMNEAAAAFSKVKVFASDNFYNAQPGFIRNFTVITDADTAEIGDDGGVVDISNYTEAMAGTWAISYSNSHQAQFTISPDGKMKVKWRNEEQELKLLPSNDEEDFPVSEGWLLGISLYRPGTWEYYQLRDYDGVSYLNVEHFCLKHCRAKYENQLDKYCCNGAGTRIAGGEEEKITWEPKPIPNAVHWDNAGPVCFGAKGDKFGAFNLTKGGKLRSMEIMHVRGWLSCWVIQPDKGREATNWGCSNHDNRPFIMIAVTTANNAVIFPTKYQSGTIYEMKGYDQYSDKLAFSNWVNPVRAKAGQEFRLWYLEDLLNAGENDNMGEICVYVRVFVE